MNQYGEGVVMADEELDDMNVNDVLYEGITPAEEDTQMEAELQQEARPLVVEDDEHFAHPHFTVNRAQRDCLLTININPGRLILNLMAYFTFVFNALNNFVTRNVNLDYSYKLSVVVYAQFSTLNNPGK